MVNGLRSRSFVSVTHKKENLADVDAVVYPRPGVDMKLNWSLNRDDVTPLNEVVCPRLFNNGATKPLLSLSAGKVDKNKTLHLDLPESAASCSHHFVVGSTAVGLSAKRSVLRRVRQEVTTHLEYNETLFVTDGLAGADSKSATMVRVMSDSADVALFAELMLAKTNPRAQTDDIRTPLKNRVKVYAATSLQTEAIKGNFTLQDDATGSLFIVGKVSSEAIAAALYGAVCGQAAAAGSVALRGTGIVGANGTTFVVGGSAGLTTTAAGRTFDSAIWAAAGLTPMFEGLMSSGSAAPSLAHGLVERVGAKTVRITHRQIPLAPARLGAPSNLVLLSTDTSLPPIAKLSAAQAGLFFLLGLEGTVAQPVLAAANLVNLLGASQTAAYVVSSKAAAASVQSVVEGKATTAAAVGDTAKLHADATAKFGSLAGAAAVLDTLK